MSGAARSSRAGSDRGVVSRREVTVSMPAERPRRLDSEHAPRDALEPATRGHRLAGGRGRRLEPYTSILPKPLMPIGNRSILEILVDQLAEAGLHRPHVLRRLPVASDSRRVRQRRQGQGVDIACVQEEEPLGTAGPLRLVEGLERTFIAMNGDLLTKIDYRKLVREHQASGNLLTIATHTRTIKADYGVLHLDGANTPTVRNVVRTRRSRRSSPR